MFKGLVAYRTRTTRLSSFAASVGLFPEESVMGPAQHAILLEAIDAVANQKDAERMVSQCRRDQFFLRWGEVNALFVPIRYAELGMEKALEHEHPEMRDVLLPKLKKALTELTCADLAACDERAKANRLRAHVLGKKMQAGYVDVDELFGRLVTL